MKTFQIPAILDNYRSLKDGGIKVTFETSELSPEQVANIHYARNKAGWLAFSPDPFATAELDEIEKTKVDFNDMGKPASQRMRGVLYRNYELNNEGYKTFVDFYNAKMEIMIDHWKKKLP